MNKKVVETIKSLRATRRAKKTSEAIRAYALAVAGTWEDLDPELEAVALENIELVEGSI